MEIGKDLQEELKKFVDSDAGRYVHGVIMGNIQWEASKLLDTSIGVDMIRETQGRVKALQELWNAVLHASGISESAQEKEAAGDE